jgi:hypothetical protein
MRAAAILGVLVLLCAPPAAWGEGPSGGEPAGTLTALEGDVQVGEGGTWRPAAVGESVAEGQFIRTGAASGADVLFSGDVAAAVGAEMEIAVSDLLLKARLEKMRTKVSAPSDTQKVQMQVTPTTGVRGTEQTEEKSEQLKREHYWNEGEKKPE